MRLFTALFVAKRYNVNSELFKRSDLKEVIDQCEAGVKNAFEYSPHTNARVATGASEISIQKVLKENGLILE